jgi:hypothetical protein
LPRPFFWKTCFCILHKNKLAKYTNPPKLKCCVKIKPYVYEIKRALSKYTVVTNKKLETEEKTVTDVFLP